MKNHLIWKFIIKNHFHLNVISLLLMIIPYYIKFYSKFWSNGVDVLIEGLITSFITYYLLCITPTHYIIHLILTDVLYIKDTNEEGETRKEYNDMLYNFCIKEYKLYNKILVTISIPVVILFWIILLVHN